MSEETLAELMMKKLLVLEVPGRRGEKIEFVVYGWFIWPETPRKVLNITYKAFIGEKPVGEVRIKIPMPTHPHTLSRIVYSKLREFAEKNL